MHGKQVNNRHPCKKIKTLIASDAIKVLLLTVRYGPGLSPVGIVGTDHAFRVSYSLLYIYHMQKKPISQAELCKMNTIFTDRLPDSRKNLYKSTGNLYTIRY